MRISASAVEEAIRINTYNGAYASREEAIKGSITAGKLADFVVLAEDPAHDERREDQGHPIVRTVVGGATMHQA